MNRIPKEYLYFSIAAIPVITAQAAMPSDVWTWVKLFASAMLAGLTAVKALQSDPPPPPK
jgi:hypothetical protein